MNESQTPSTARTTALVVLAAIGFVSIIGASMWLAVYATRYVPSVVNRVGSAAVYLGSFFNPATPAAVSVVPSPTPTLPFDRAATTTPSASSTPPVATSTPAVVPPKFLPTTPGPATTTTYPLGSTTPTTIHTGLPDLVVTISAVGYLTSTSTESFIATSTVPNGNRPAVKFTIKNVGGGVAAPWRFSAVIPTQSAYVFQSPPQQQLAPGESIDYTLGFDQANKGTGQMISVSANFDHAISESNSNNNSATAYITVLGS